MENTNDDCCGCAERDGFELIVGIFLAVIAAASMGFLIGESWSESHMTREQAVQHLSASDRQTIAIDFEKANGSWRSTLHNPCNFSPMDADKETK